jgi:hypothetical protein
MHPAGSALHRSAHPVTVEPSRHAAPALWARITARTIEIFRCGKRVAAHVRSSSNRQHTTVCEHMPSSHQRYADWTPERLRRQAGAIGRHTAALVEIILRERARPEQGIDAHDRKTDALELIPKLLHTTGTVIDGGTLRYRAAKRDCDVCALKMQCSYANTAATPVPPAASSKNCARLLIITARKGSARPLSRCCCHRRASRATAG